MLSKYMNEHELNTAMFYFFLYLFKIINKSHVIMSYQEQHVNHQ